MMVEIFSRGDGPRPQDARLKAFLDKNRSTIVKIADHLTQGQYSAGKTANAAVSQEEPRTIVHALGEHPRTTEPRPVVRATLNGRVVVVDDNSGRQVHHLGEIRRRGEEITFLLASAENGFSAPLPDELLDALIDLDRAALASHGGEEALVQELASRLGIE
jgi:hypothetical protein